MLVSLSPQPVTIYRQSLYTSGPWKSSPKSTLQQLFFTPLRLTCKSIYSQRPPMFGGLNWWLLRGDSLTGSVLTHAKRKPSKPVVVKESSAMEDDIREGLNEISNEAVKAMCTHNSKAIDELKEKVDYLERYLIEEGETEAAKFMLIIAGMLDHMVPAEKDELNDVHKAALKKMWNIVEDSGWILKFENEEAMQEMVDDELIPPVLHRPY